MAEAAQAQASAALSPQRDIKQEPNALDHFDFSMADHSTTHFNGPVEPATPTAPNGTPAPGTHGTPVANGTPTPAPSLALPAPPMSPTKRARNDLETSVESPEAKRPKTEAQNDAPATQLPIPSSSTPGQPVTQNQLAMPQPIQSHPPAHPSVASHSHALALPQSQPSSQPTTTPTQPAEQAQAQTQEPVQSSVESHALQEFTAPSQPLEPSSTHSQPAEDDYDEQMNLLVQNALSNINDMMDQFDPEAEDQEAGGAMGGQSEEKEPISFIDEPSKFTHNSFINALGNTAVAMLLLLCSKPHEDMVARLRDPNSEHRRCHMQYSKTLEALKLHYSDKSILLATDYDIRSDMAGTIIQFVNLTQLGEWLLDGSFDSICEADRNLPKVFRDERLGLTQNIVNLMMGIKTQRLIKTVQSKEDKKLSEEELQGIFLESAEKQLEEHGITNLVHGSDKTITSCLSERVEELRNLTAETNIIEKYSTAELLRTFCEYANNQLAVAEQLSERLGFTRPKFEEPAVANEPTAEDLLDFASFFEKNTEEMIQNTLAGLEDLPSDVPTTTNGDMPNPPAVDGPNQQTEAPQANGSFTDYKDFEALVAESTSNYVRTTLQGLSPTPYQPKVPTSTTESMAAQVQQANHLNNTQQQAQQNPYYQTYPQTAVDHHHQQQQQPQQLQVPDQQPPQQTHGQGLPPNQTCSSAQLYEKARQAALSRSTAHTRREGLHSTRRPWSQEEEKALMTGLDMVKGPHWSQILGLFGVNGTLSDILRDRTQVQLKDKARNLKLFFLKTNSEMPFYLNSVTGELKTRAPTQAARKEAEERARQNSHEEQAKLNTIMTYSNGLQQSPQNRTHAGGVVTPAHAAAQAAAQNRTPAQASPPQMSYNAGSIPFSSTQQQPIQGYGTQPVPQVHHAHTQPHTPSPQSQAQPPMTNGSQGSPHEHNDQNVKQESHNQPDTDTYDQQSRALLEQLQRVAHDQVSAQTTPYNTHTSQRFTSPGHEQKASVSQSPAPGSTAIATPSQPQSQQQQASTANQSHNPSQSPASGQAAPSSSSTPAPPAPAAHMVEAPTSAVAPNQLAPSVEQDGSAPPVDPGAEAEFVGFDADAEAALLRDLQAAMSDP